MSKKFQLQIPTPCHESWDNMSPVEKGRFCSSCAKQVVDFSNMSDREVAMFFKKPSTGSVCGRFMTEQLERDIEIPKKRIPWLRYFFQFFLPGILFSAKAGAQVGKVRAVSTDTTKVFCTPIMLGQVSFTPRRMLDTIITTPVITTNLGIKRTPIETLGVTITMSPQQDVIIKGKIINEKNEPIPYASVIIKGTNSGTAASEDGSFKIKTINNKAILIASSVGFEPKEIVLKDYKLTDNLMIQLKSNVNLGEVVITSLNGTHCTHSMGLVSSAVTIKREKVFPPDNNPSATFKVYPNPAPSNSTMHIEWNQTENGYHLLQLFNLQGQVIFTKEMFIDDEAKLLSVDLPSLTAGNYFLKMINKKTSRSYTSKIIVE